LEASPVGASFLKLGTRNVARAPVTEVVQKQVQFGELPVLTTWREDGGPFITLPLVYTDINTKKHNLGIYRMQIYDANTAGLHWQIQKGGGFHYLLTKLNQNFRLQFFGGRRRDHLGHRAFA
jgi:UbiD family decarboxylase